MKTKQAEKEVDAGVSREEGKTGWARDLGTGQAVKARWAVIGYRGALQGAEGGRGGGSGAHASERTAALLEMLWICGISAEAASVADFVHGVHCS